MIVWFLPPDGTLNGTDGEGDQALTALAGPEAASSSGLFRYVSQYFFFLMEPFWTGISASDKLKNLNYISHRRVRNNERNKKCLPIKKSSS